LETDVNGIVKTTANDLVKFFDNPSSEESKEVLDRLERICNSGERDLYF
jgi:hypothetical protein